MRVYESAYTGPLDQMMISDSIESEFEITEDQKDDKMIDSDHDDSIVYDGPTVQSIKALSTKGSQAETSGIEQQRRF